nr:elongation factor 1-delta isoform X3 [Aotus nancymaae]
MRSEKASSALETVWKDKRKYEEAERRFYEHEAARAAASAQQLPAEGQTVNGPRQDDPEDVDEAEAPDCSSRSDSRKSQDGRKPLQKKRKRSPADLALVGLSADHVWLDKSLFDQAESSYRRRLADAAAQAAWPPALAPWGPCTHGSQVACHHVTWGIWVNKSAFDQAERAFVEWSQALLLAPDGSHREETPDTGQEVAVPDLVHQPSPPVNGQPPLGSLQALVREVWLEKPRRKMATNFLVHEKIWFDKFKYDDAERRFYEQMNGPVAGVSRQENGASVILRDIARARENIQKSLAGSSGPGASSSPSGDHSELVVRIASLEVENQSLRGVVQELQQAVSKLEARLNVLEKSSPGHRATAPQTQHVSPMRQVEPPTKKPATPAEDDEDDDIDLFGSDNEEEDKEAAQLREERLRQYAEKKARKPAPVARSSILLDVKPWDDETDMAQLESCVRSIQLDGLVWGASKLVPVGYGIRKLQIQCVVEDDKVGTDLLEEEITKFEEHVQSVDIAAFNKI